MSEKNLFDSGASPELMNLLQEARAGSDRALDALFEELGPRLLSMVRLRLGPELRARMESRDVLADCLLTAFEKLGQFQGSERESFQAWLSRIVERRLLDLAEFHKRQRRDLHREETFDDDDPAFLHSVRSHTSRIALDRDMQRLERALESLPEDYREAILLRKLQGLSFDEMSQRLARSPDACRMLVARALTSLTTQFGEDG